jgi:chitin disaccharide deacetylase
VTKHLIVNADDLGISIPVNLAIRRGFCDGIVTSASLLVNMPALGHAVEEVIRPSAGLGVGVHLCATSGPPVLPPERLPLLVEQKGDRPPFPERPERRFAESAPVPLFRRGFVGLWRLLHSRRREEALGQIQEEWAAQIARAEALGLQIDHLDGHQHVHMIPALFYLVVELARTRSIAIRVAGEAFRLWQRGPLGVLACLANGGLVKNAVLRHFARRNRRKWPNILSTDHYFGALDTGRMTSARLRNILESLPDGVSEVTVHPSLPAPVSELAPAATPGSEVRADHLPYPASGEASGVRAPDEMLSCNPQDQRFLLRRHAAEELAALVDPTVREIVAARGIKLTHFQDLPGVH